MLPSSVTPEGIFCVGVHAPSYHVLNKRECNYPITLGGDEEDAPVSNSGNFKDGTIEIEDARAIYEIRNPFPFRGCTYIDSGLLKPVQPDQRVFLSACIQRNHYIQV